MKRFALLALLLFISAGFAQDSREQLGPADKLIKDKGPHPLVAVMNSVNAKLLPELVGKHPRVFFTEDEFSKLVDRAKTTHREQWKDTVSHLRALKEEPPPNPADQRRAQNTVGIAIAEGAFAYRINHDPKVLAAVKRYMDAAVSYDVWGYRTNKPDVDLAAGHLLYGMGTAYDLLYNDLTPEERSKYRNKIVRQARKLYDYYLPKPGRSYSYSQNHVFIPIAGLGVAAYALYDEVPDAPEWAKLSRAIYDRVLATYSQDGYYYEGFEYWTFSTPWIIHYLDAHAHSTGEDLFDQPGLRNAHLYVAHSMVPGAQTIFDFGDVFEGPLTRAGKGDEYARSHPAGRFHTNYNLLYRLAARYQSPEIQGVADWLKSQRQINAEDFWTLAWYDGKLKSTSINDMQPWHHFKDHDVFYWRSDWTSAGTAFAFKSGPPEGHHTTAALKQFPDWHLSAGHSHPDANSFIIFSGGQYLTGDSGYAGVPKAEQHNTLLVDGKGQANEGAGHDPWDRYDNALLNTIAITNSSATKHGFTVSGQAAGAYKGLTSYLRTVAFDGSSFSVTDRIVADEPRVFSTLLHSDSALERKNEQEFLLRSVDGSVLPVKVFAPLHATFQIQPNFVTAPGPPGSVDKGEQQKRGERLAIAAPEAAREVQFQFNLQLTNRMIGKQ